MGTEQPRTKPGHEWLGRRLELGTTREQVQHSTSQTSAGFEREVEFGGFTISPKYLVGSSKYRDKRDREFRKLYLQKRTHLW